MSFTHSRHSRRSRIALAALALSASSAAAQERLTRAITVSVGAFAESYSFGDGLAQAAGASASGAADASSVVKSASQFAVPVTIAVPIGTRWSADVATVYTTGTAKLAVPNGAAPNGTAPNGAESRATLSGVGDVRLRATGRIVGDNLLLTLGANVGSGVRELTAGQVQALGVFAAPALGAVMPAASAGPSATSGLVYAVRGAGWSWAAGAGVEVRGHYAPVAALTAGLSAPTFDPGTAVHLSLGADGFVGEGSLSVSLTGDLYTQDRLLVSDAAGASAGASNTSGGTAASVQLGPTFGAELQYRAPSRTFREIALYASERYRAPFTRDGAHVSGTSANYVNAGARAAYPLGRATDLTASVDGWVHGGLSADNTLVTAKTTSGALGLGLARRFGTYTVQPYARLRVGTIDTGAGSTNVTGGGAGVNLSARF